MSVEWFVVGVQLGLQVGELLVHVVECGLDVLLCGGEVGSGHLLFNCLLQLAVVEDVGREVPVRDGDALGCGVVVQVVCDDGVVVGVAVVGVELLLVAGEELLVGVGQAGQVGLGFGAVRVVGEVGVRLSVCVWWLQFDQIGGIG